MSKDRFETAPNEWDAVVKDYARVSEPLTTPFGLDTLAAVQPRAGERLLDLATGTGAVALAAGRRGVTVVAVDWAPGMVDYVAARAQSEHIEGLSAQVMGGQNLQLPTASFDLACSVFGVFLFPNYRAGLAELLRVLKPGGRVGVTAWAHTNFTVDPIV